MPFVYSWFTMPTLKETTGVSLSEWLDLHENYILGKISSEEYESTLYIWNHKTRKSDEELSRIGNSILERSRELDNKYGHLVGLVSTPEKSQPPQILITDFVDGRTRTMDESSMTEQKKAPRSSESLSTMRKIGKIVLWVLAIIGGIHSVNFICQYI